MKRTVKRVPVYYNPSFLSTADFWPERQDLRTDWYLPLAVRVRRKSMLIVLTDRFLSELLQDDPD